MWKIKIVVDRHPAEVAVPVLEVDSLQNGAPVLHRVAHAIRRAPGQHRLLTFLGFCSLWAVLQFYLHMDAAAHTVEVFGVAPFADQAMKLFCAIKE